MVSITPLGVLELDASNPQTDAIQITFNMVNNEDGTWDMMNEKHGPVFRFDPNRQASMDDLVKSNIFTFTTDWIMTEARLVYIGTTNGYKSIRGNSFRIVHDNQVVHEETIQDYEQMAYVLSHHFNMNMDVKTMKSLPAAS